MRTFLITGGAGFVGAHMVEHILKNTKDKVIVVDSLTYSGSLDRLRDIKIDPAIPRYPDSALDMIEVFTWDFRTEAEPNLIKELSEVTHVLHMGAESHVDHSIEDPMRFCMSNVNGTVNMLNLARKLPNLELFMYFSTDEVFGPAPMEEKVGDCKVSFYDGFKEDDQHQPKNPYAASKSAAEQFVTSFANTYSLPCIITRQMNIFGERQHPEKFIPLCINRALNGGKIQIHANSDCTQAGMRHYIHARNVADAHLFLLDKRPWLEGSIQDVPAYHIVGELEIDNLALAKLIDQYTGIIADSLDIHAEGVTEFELVDFHSSRPGHDLRYALDGSKMKELGWEPPNHFHQSMKKNIRWTLENQNWLK